MGKREILSLKTINKKELIIGAVVLIALIIIGGSFLSTSNLFYRMLVGLGLGYALNRSMFGFAGTANRAYSSGSTKLIRIMALMFFLTATCVAVILFANSLQPEESQIAYSISANAINLGLLVGGVMFGVGMSFCTCCASGALTVIASRPLRGIITIFFFGVGVFIGFPLQATQTWITDTVISSSSSQNGVFFPDLFKFDGMNGYLGAVILTGVLCLITAGIAKAYENSRRRKGTYTPVASEERQEKAEIELLQDNDVTPVFSETTAYRLFAKPWTLKMGAVIITILFTTLVLVTLSGWGVSTPYGNWFGRLLVSLGVPLESVTGFSLQSEAAFTGAFFETAMNVQNFCIIAGAIIANLMMGVFSKEFKKGIKITPKEFFIYMIGGLLMGVGTRFANGCNAGALYTPIASFSLSGWIYFIFLFGGGMFGMWLRKRYFAAGKK